MSTTNKDTNKDETSRKYGFSLLDLASETEQLSIDDQVALSPTSSRAPASSVGSGESQAPTFVESLPSEKSADRDWGSKTTSRASSAEHTTPCSEVSSSEQDDSDVSQADVNGQKFEFRKLNPAHIPKGWSNDSKDLEPVHRTLSTDEYSLQPFVLPIVASGWNGQACQYLFSIFKRFYVWTPASSELLYVTQSYNLRGILKRIHGNSIELRTKPLEPLSHWYSQHQITHLPLWFWQIPRGWSQDEKGLKEIKELIDDGLKYGLPLPIPILVSDGRHGGTFYFMNCGDRYYIYLDVSGYLHRVEEPTELSKILRILGRKEWDGLKLTICNILPEYGGPDTVPDEEVPAGWSNRISQDACDTGIFDRYDISLPSPLIFRDGGNGLPPIYLVRSFRRFYLWDTVSNDVSRILQPKALQDILDFMKNSSDKLTLSSVAPGGRPKRPCRKLGDA